MKVAALDLGTNTFILLIVEVAPSGEIQKIIHDEVRVVRLGQGVHASRMFHPDALIRADECFSDFAEIIARNKVDRTLACATSAARDVTNQKTLFEIAARHHIPLEIISGEQEAELTYWGAIPQRQRGPLVIIDVGGGSTEFILGDQQGLVVRQSFDIGAVRLTELFVKSHPIDSATIDKLKQYIQHQLLGMDSRFLNVNNKTVMAVAGTPTTLAAVVQGQKFDTQLIEGFRLTLSMIQTWGERLAGMTIAERQILIGMDPKRADVIVAGALILQIAGECMGINEMQVSTRGLRFGVARTLGRGGII
jgi:exopolyphosphatase/guanosine-5'-triphosphate,3'-diphosphate pyrophosphatase